MAEFCSISVVPCLRLSDLGLPLSTFCFSESLLGGGLISQPTHRSESVATKAPDGNVQAYSPFSISYFKTARSYFFNPVS